MNHLARLVAAVSGAALVPLLACPTAVAAPANTHSVDLATSTQALHYRIPAMTVTPRGTIITAFDRRHGSDADLPGDIDTMVRRSTDHGATWSAPDPVVDRPAPQGCGDPSLLTDHTTGRVHLFCTYSHGEVGFQDSQPGSADSTDPHTLHVWEMTSDDDGATWSAPTDLNRQVKKPEWAGVFASSGHGVQTASGRLLQPIVVRDAQGKHHSANIYSDDHGKTWHHGALLADGTDESKAVAFPNGRVVQNSRSVQGGQRLLSTSTNGGISFGRPTERTDLPDPGVNADEIRVDTQHDDGRLLFSNPANPEQRADLTIRLSCDHGKSWSRGTVLHSGAASYSTMAMLPDGQVGVFAEHGQSSPSGKLTFTSFPLTEVGRC